MFDHPLVVAAVVSLVAIAAGCAAVWLDSRPVAGPVRRRLPYMDGWR